MRRPSIFVAIASYTDVELTRTVASAEAGADDPERIFYGIVDQSPTTRAQAALARISPRIAYDHVHPRDSLGCCWARARCQRLWRGEEHALQVDSHTRFEPGWDRRLTAQFTAIVQRSGNLRTLLSTMPSAFRYAPDGSIVAQPHLGWRVVAEPHERWVPGDRPPRFHGVPAQGDLPQRGLLIAAGFVFGPGFWCEALAYDPELYFAEEQLALSLRAHTCGWDVWHPADAPLLHLYDPSGRNGRHLRHWDTFEEQRPESAAALQARSARRLKKLVDGKVEAPLGLGDRRPSAAFWDAAGIRIERGTATP